MVGGAVWPLALYVVGLSVACALGGYAERAGGWAALAWRWLPVLLVIVSVLVALGALAPLALAGEGYGYPEGYPVTGAGAAGTGMGVGAVSAPSSVAGAWGSNPLDYLLTLGPFGALLWGAVMMGRAIEKISTMQITVQVKLSDEDRAAVRELGAGIKTLAERSAERGGERGVG